MSKNKVFTGWDDVQVAPDDKIDEMNNDLVAPYQEDGSLELEEPVITEGEEEDVIGNVDDEQDQPLVDDLKLDARVRKASSFANEMSSKMNQTLSQSQKQDINLFTQQSSRRAQYGVEFDPSLEEDLRDGTGGLYYRATIYRDGYYNAKNKHFLPDKSLKPRRPIATAYESEFFGSLTLANDKWVFQGKLNGWPALTNLELVSLQYWYSKKAGPKAVTYSRTFWKSSTANGQVPGFPQPGKFSFNKKPVCIRATLRAPKFTELGYSKGNPGFLWWFRPFRNLPIEDGGPKMGHGRNLLTALEHDREKGNVPIARATNCHFYAHRYAKKVETPKDKITYHTGVVVEWNHGEFCTNIELAYLFGLGGSGGKSNWCLDRNENQPLLWRCMPDCIKSPWMDNRSELRMTDFPVKDLEEFKAYFEKFKGSTGRFIKPMIKYSGPVRLTLCTDSDIVNYLLNYSLRERYYSEEFRNCQTFAADFFSFLAAKNTAEPLYPVKLFYREKRHCFLYNPDQFEMKAVKGEAGKDLKKKKKKKKASTNNAKKGSFQPGNVIKKLLGN